MVSGAAPPWQSPLRIAHVPVALHLALVLALGLWIPPFLDAWFRAAAELLR